MFRLRSSTLGTVFTNVGMTVLGLVNSILLSRWLGPYGRGEIAAAMLWPVMLIYLVSMGIMSSIIYFVALPESKASNIFANSMALAAAQCLVVLPIGFFAMPWLLSSQSDRVVFASRLYLLVIPLSLVAQYAVCILLGRLRMASYNLLRAIVPVGYLAGVIILHAAGRLGILEIVILHLCLSFLNLACTMAALIKSGTRPSLRGDKDLGKRMLKYGLQVHVGDMSQAANLRLDQALMAGLLPSFQLGLYVMAVSAANFSQALSSAVRLVVTPRIAKEVSASEQTAILYGMFRKYLFVSLVAIVAMATALPFAVPVVFGPDFAGAIWPAEVLLVGALFIGAKDVLAGGVQALGKPWLGSRAELMSLVVTVVLLAALLPPLGIMGAAIATTIAYATQLVIVIYGLNRSFNISPSLLFHIRLSDLKSLPLLSRLGGPYVETERTKVS